MSFAEGYTGTEGQEPVSELTRRRLEVMIAVALLNPDERERYEKKAIWITEEEALKLIGKLIEYMPIMGLHSYPLDMREQGIAIKYQVAKDDWHEERWKK